MIRRRPRRNPNRNIAIIVGFGIVFISFLLFYQFNYSSNSNYYSQPRQVNFNFSLKTIKDLKNISVEIYDQTYKVPKVHQEIDTLYNLELIPETAYRLSISNQDTTFFIKDFDYWNEPNLFLELIIEVDSRIRVTDEYFEAFMNL